MIFDVFVWSQLELQLGIMCAALPALRVFFRKYLNEPIARVMHDTNRSLTSRQSNRASDLVIRRIHGPEDQYERNDFGARHAKSLSEVTVSEEEQDQDSPVSLTTSTYELIKTPADYEAYNLQTLDRHRHSAIARPASRGRNGTQNFSQPFSVARSPV